MSGSDPSFIAAPIAAAVAAIVTIAQAVPAIEKRLGRVGDLESQIGRMPPLVQCAYTYLHIMYKGILIGVAITGITMVFGYILKDIPILSFFVLPSCTMILACRSGRP